MAIVLIHHPKQMKSDALGQYIEEQMRGVCLKLIELKPYIEELWTRFERGEQIRGCRNKKQFCEQILHRTPQTVRLMLAEKISPLNRTQAQLETSCATPEHLRYVRELREWIKSETPNAQSHVYVQPCGYGYGAGMGCEQVLAGKKIEDFFDLQLRSLTSKQVKAVCKFFEQEK